jgi:hypothetical protein
LPIADAGAVFPSRFFSAVSCCALARAEVPGATEEFLALFRTAEAGVVWPRLK